MAKKHPTNPNIPANPHPVQPPANMPAPKRGDETRNALVNLLEAVDGAQMMKDKGEHQEKVMEHLQLAIADFMISPGIHCDVGAIGFGITLNRIVVEAKYSDDSGAYEVTYTARRFD
jgi:hypothetical protein